MSNSVVCVHPSRTVWRHKRRPQHLQTSSHCMHWKIGAVYGRPLILFDIQNSNFGKYQIAGCYAKDIRIGVKIFFYFFIFLKKLTLWFASIPLGQSGATRGGHNIYKHLLIACTATILSVK